MITDLVDLVAEAIDPLAFEPGNEGSNDTVRLWRARNLARIAMENSSRVKRAALAARNYDRELLNWISNEELSKIVYAALVAFAPTPEEHERGIEAAAEAIMKSECYSPRGKPDGNEYWRLNHKRLLKQASQAVASYIASTWEMDDWRLPVRTQDKP